MKKSELSKLIREEIRKTVKEIEYQPSYTHMKPYAQEIQQQIKTLEVLNDRIEDKGPLSEEIEDVLEILRDLASKIQQAR
jgi:predicted house-cleaning noncanonical NTP pyrophosphatase (MazG superfamily)